MRNRLVIVLALVVGLLTPAASTPRAVAFPVHPRLLFSASDVAALQSKILSGVPAQAWTRLKSKVDAYLDPTHPLAMADNTTYEGNPDRDAAYLLDLAAAYRLSGDNAYGDAAVEHMRALGAKSWPVSTQSPRELLHGNLARAAGLAFDWTYDRMSATDRTAIISSLVAEIPTAASTYDGTKLFSCIDEDWKFHTATGDLRTQPGMNWYGVCAGGVGIALMAIDGETGVPSLTTELDVARGRNLHYLDNVYGSLGDGAEGIHYACYGLKNSLPFTFAWERETAEDLLALAPGVSEVSTWLSFEMLPGVPFNFVPRNDSYTIPAFCLESAAHLFEADPDGVTAWMWDHTIGPDGYDFFGPTYPVWPGNSAGVKGADALFAAFNGWLSSETFTILYYRSASTLARTAPETVTALGRHYPERGLATMRTGWDGGADEVVATFEAKRRHDNTKGHSQHDVGSFTIYGYGARFGVDMGYGHDYSCGNDPAPGVEDPNATAGICNPNSKLIASGRSSAHNLMVPDGDAAAAQAGRSIDHSDPTITTFVDAPNLTFLDADVRRAYTNVPSTVTLARRGMALTRAVGEPVVVVVTDSLDRDNLPHRYYWRMLTDAANAVGVNQQAFNILAPNQARLTGYMAAGQVARLATVSGFGDLAGAYAHVVQGDSVLAATVEQIDHLAVMAITPPGVAAPTFTQPAATGGSAVRLEWGTGPNQGAYYLMRNDGAAAVTIGTQVYSDGKFAKLTFAKGETIMYAGSDLTTDVRNYVHVTGGTATVVVSGGTVKVTDGTGTGYHVYAPQAISTVTVNGAAVTPTRTGDYLEF